MAGPLSVLDIFKIGVGPSSSHTMGPWKAARVFAVELEALGCISHVDHVKIDLYGSLALTGKGHGTDIAVIMGLGGFEPRTVTSSELDEYPGQVLESGILSISGKQVVKFNVDEDIIFHFGTSLDYHSNGLVFTVYDTAGQELHSATYYSTGGGFVVKEGEPEEPYDAPDLQYPIDTASDIIRYCSTLECSISEVVTLNERAWRVDATTEAELMAIWRVMKQSIFKGCHTDGVLPGGLQVRRRAPGLHRKLIGQEAYFDEDEWTAQIRKGVTGFDEILQWISCFALAVNEENAAFGRVVTAPTNGAAGVIPAVLMYLLCFKPVEDDIQVVIRFLKVAAEIGCLFKKRATISAAMGGCQAEIGVSSAMAAAGLTECLGGTPKQALMAAEIAMEHHLGLTCDPVSGLVQVPCIERNSMGAIKAITAARLALESDPDFARVSLDDVIKTMWDTARDMSNRYKETSQGGLAVNISVVEPEC